MSSNSLRVFFSTIAVSGFALALGLTQNALASDLYKWVDANGVVHYSDTPPPTSTKNAERLRVNQATTAEVDSNTPAADAADKPKDDKDAKPATPNNSSEMPDTPENRAHICERSHMALDVLQSKFQVADSSGKPLDDKARAARIDSEKRVSAAYCQP